ncbi:MAG TPA: CRISPR-associated endonuclease Cas3'', partial [Lacipirellulaceae bacterium]
MSRYFAHSLPGRPIEEWEPLEDHLQAVSDLAGTFADKFGAAEWGRVTGLWHDVGKYSAEFQDKLLLENGFEAHLENQPNRVDHSTAGAQHASKSCTSFGFAVGDLIAYCIAGHHAGLANRVADHGQTGLDCRLKKRIPSWSAAPRELAETTQLPLPPLTFDKDQARAVVQLSLFTRMLFSCLVDADYLATELFMSPERAVQRPAIDIGLAKMRARLDEYLAELVAGRR